jgi:hypothetical protein
MSSTYSQSLRIELIGPGDQAGSWGATTNNSFAYVLDTAIAGYQTAAVVAANQALTYVNGASSNGTLNESIYAILRLTTSTGANFSVYAPPAPKTYIIFNDSLYTATIYNSTVIGNTTAAGVGVTIPAGNKVMVWSNGTSFFNVQAQELASTLAIANGGTGQTTQQAAINALTGTQTDARVLRSDGTNATLSQVVLSTDVSGVLPANSGGTGVANNAASTLAITGDFASTFVVTGTYTYTFPGASGTLATLAGSETFTNKTLTNPTVTNYVESVVAIGTVTTSNTLSLTNGTVQTATLTASTACTFTMPAATAGKSFILLLKQAATTGNGTATFSGVKWGLAGAPTITATAGKMDILTFVADGTNWYGSVAQGYTP